MNMNRVEQIAYFLLRVVAGLLFAQVGSKLLLGWFGGLDGAGSTAPLMSQTGVGGALEFFGGLMILLGVLTRPTPDSCATGGGGFRRIVEGG